MVVLIKSYLLLYKWKNMLDLNNLSTGAMGAKKKERTGQSHLYLHPEPLIFAAPTAEPLSFGRIPWDLQRDPSLDLSHLRVFAVLLAQLRFQRDRLQGSGSHSEGMAFALRRSTFPIPSPFCSNLTFVHSDIQDETVGFFSAWPGAPTILK